VPEPPPPAAQPTKVNVVDRETVTVQVPVVVKLMAVPETMLRRARGAAGDRELRRRRAEDGAELRAARLCRREDGNEEREGEAGCLTHHCRRSW
jgi:hypothetical protein